MAKNSNSLFELETMWLLDIPPRIVNLLIGTSMERKERLKKFVDMKYLVLLMFSLTVYSLKAQVINEIKKCEIDSIDGMLVHSLAEIQPEYERGLQKFYSEISSKIKLKAKNELGCVKVVLSFVIDVDGNIRNLCFTDNVEIVEDVIESINNWIPGKTGGINVPVRMYLPMYIKLG
jgi:hypothetical protein